MNAHTYNAFKNDAMPYIPCTKGIFAYHKATETLILIQQITSTTQSTFYNCLILQSEFDINHFCSATYSQNEIIPLNVFLEDFIKKHNQIIGVQLTLF